ncbi:LLM class F420-dependent oxidoreductase [Mycolicibacterium chitae]|uniref:F420-dependent oxidoreductase, MSMEG_4879 family n=1 Tax=Mycolicibacterium chitae TaxID=1792 RepID=A0A3S4TIV1_MYCCI|nr:TIGR03564 family F420-dependent LLM class oxidoreductase [Mycolicibacterium chitae]MCV7104585.1 TIGR03564 family F420-dependent LLM class oxidoreductase [Mycolicibacterium chitae]BBZ02781.1 LLM class F420-dependent oxidoreductase [Mycolicibacterium chitae]VEG45673.1 F420-dependent oxidoreductase, MSMEG_4879 family [Mycolicibacterium chitae]
MPAGVVLSPSPTAVNVVDDIVEQAQRAHELGVRQVWLAQQFDIDAITLAALIGTAVPGLGVGTSVVPINPRHPLIVASAAQTAQAASHGRFSLGLGLGAHELEREAFGISPVHTVDRLREHLTVLRAILDDGEVDFRGRHLTASPRWPVRVAGGAPIPIYVAAMGPKALRVTGELADGTLPYLAGPRTVAEFIVPTITEPAAQAGRPAPRVLAGVPVAVTDRVQEAGDLAAAALALYDSIPSYQRVVAREGLSSAAELAVIGSADTVHRRLSAYRDAGATDIVVATLQRDDRAALEDLWRVVAAL